MNVDDRDYIERRYHLSWGEGWRRSPRYGLPILDRESIIPDHVVPFDKISSACDEEFSAHSCVIFNLADRRIDRFWNNPERFISRLKKFGSVATPDFSLLLDMERPFVEYNVLRALKIGHWMQDNGMHVLPSLLWAYPDTYDVCFEAIPRNGIVIVSSVGSMRRQCSRRYFMMGMKSMLERVSPSGVILYGPMPQFEFPVPVVRHFERVSPTWFNAYQPDMISSIINQKEV